MASIQSVLVMDQHEHGAENAQGFALAVELSRVNAKAVHPPVEMLKE